MTHTFMTMKIYILVNVLVRIYHLTDALKVDYCKLPCHINNKTVEHIMCTLKNDCSVGPECKVKTKFDYTQDLKSFTLNMHNYFRNKVAFGEAFGQHKGNLPQAADMLEMVWDEELAYFAQCYANKCILQYDKCRQSSGGQNIGQLIFIRVFVNPKSVEDIIMEMLEYVYHSSKAMPLEDIEKYKDNKHTRQFTQLVWSRTNRVGCGITKLLEDLSAFLMVCNYGPAGNIAGEKVYNVGFMCSSCPDDRDCGNTFSGLCAATEEEIWISKQKTEGLRALEGVINTEDEGPGESYRRQTGTEIGSKLERTRSSNNFTTSTSEREDVPFSEISTFATYNDDVTAHLDSQEIEYFSTKEKVPTVLFGRLVNEVATKTPSTTEIPIRMCIVKRKYNWPDFGNQDSGAQPERTSIYFMCMYILIYIIFL